MGQLCSRPRTAEDKPAASLHEIAKPGHERKSSHLASNGRPEELHARHVLAESQPSDAASSELDVVVQHLHESNYSVTGSAPELLQQWDHDHRVVLDSIEAAIQVLIAEHRSSSTPPCFHAHSEKLLAFSLCRGPISTGRVQTTSTQRTTYQLCM